MADQTVTVVRAKGVLDVDLGEVLEGASIVIEGNRITSVTDAPPSASDVDEVIDLPDLTLVPGLMDMEVDLVLGGPGANLTDPVRMDPVKMGLRAVANGQRTLRAGFTTVRNLGLFIKTGGYLVDVALADAIAAGWVEGPRVIPAGHAICPTGGHLDPSAQNGLAPGIMRMTVEEGIADGVDEVRKAVRYQITHGAKLIKCVGSGGVMTPTGPPGAQQYSDDELAAIADEAHRRGLRVAIHAHGDTAVNAAIDAGIDCVEHGMMIGDDTIQRLVDTGTFLVSTCALTENWDISDQPRSLQAKAAEVFPKARESLSKAIEAGVKVALGTDAPAIFHGRNAEELDVLVKRGMTPIQAIRAATTVSAELIDMPDLGRIAPEMLADLIGVTGDPLVDIATFRRVPFVMKDGKVAEAQPSGDGMNQATDDIWEVLATTRAIRRFTDEPVDEATLNRCLEAATWAPSGGNVQHWRFIVLDSPEMRAVVQQAADAALKVIEPIYGMTRPAPDDTSRNARRDRATYELHDLAGQRTSVLFVAFHNEFSSDFLQGASIFPAVQNFYLAARAQGLGACPTSWAAYDGEQLLRQAVGIPEGWVLAGHIVVGWPRGHHGPVRRRPVSDVVFHNGWDPDRADIIYGPGARPKPKG